jgi:hypothetical protein
MRRHAVRSEAVPCPHDTLEHEQRCSSTALEREQRRSGATKRLRESPSLASGRAILRPGVLMTRSQPDALEHGQRCSSTALEREQRRSGPIHAALVQRVAEQALTLSLARELPVWQVARRSHAAL